MLKRRRSRLRTSPGCRSIETKEFLLAISKMKPQSQLRLLHLHQPRKVRKRLPACLQKVREEVGLPVYDILTALDLAVAGSYRPALAGAAV